MNTKTPAWTVTNSGVTIYTDGQTYQLPASDSAFPAVIECIKAQDWEGAISEMDRVGKVNSFGAGKVVVKNGCVYYRNQVVQNVIVDRILSFISKGLPVEPLVAFLENCMGSDSFIVVNELYLFLEDNELPLTEDGAFLAYRRVDANYMSMHANPDGTHTRNMVGDVVDMPRNQVNPDRDQTCERGLHFCSRSYLPHYGSTSNGDRTMVVKIWPKDVIAIPSDYNNQKGRCCAYEVEGEHVEGDTKSAFSSPLYEAKGAKPVTYHNVRDSHGKFTTKSY